MLINNLVRLLLSPIHNALFNDHRYDIEVENIFPFSLTSHTFAGKYSSLHNEPHHSFFASYSTYIWNSKFIPF
jgi:hypothetical protein